MRKEAKVAVAVAVPIVVAGVAYLISKAQAGLQKYLYISAGEGGTTDPPPGSYLKSLGENVTITGLPNEGYTVGTWVVDEVDWGHQDSITVTMDTDHTVIVTFWKGGEPPASYPVNIIPLGSINVTQNIGVAATQEFHDWVPHNYGHTHHHYCDENWSLDSLVRVPMRFKVVDAAGVGVPEVDVALWTSMYDDSEYRGMVLLNGGSYPVDSPLVVKTDADGIAVVYVSYLYGLGDQNKTICADAGMGGWVLLYPTPVPWKITCPNSCFDCYKWEWAWLYSVFGEGESGVNLPRPWMNEVFANVVGTALTTREAAWCGFHIKWV